MNDDYLWNKTGSDPDIGELEEALAVFRYEPDAAPMLPVAETKAVHRFSWTLWLRLAFAGTAAAVVAISVGLWAVQEREVADAGSPRIANTLPEAQTRSERAAAAPVKPADPQPADLETAEKPNVASVRSTRKRQDANTRKAVARSARPALTKEEKYAYDQLMLALSITESKLRIVRDTIDGNEGDTARATRR